MKCEFEIDFISEIKCFNNNEQEYLDNLTYSKTPRGKP